MLCDSVMFLAIVDGLYFYPDAECRQTSDWSMFMCTHSPFILS